MGERLSQSFPLSLDLLHLDGQGFLVGFHLLFLVIDSFDQAEEVLGFLLASIELLPVIVQLARQDLLFLFQILRIAYGRFQVRIVLTDGHGEVRDGGLCGFTFLPQHVQAIIRLSALAGKLLHEQANLANLFVEHSELTFSRDDSEAVHLATSGNRARASDDVALEGDQARGG